MSACSRRSTSSSGPGKTAGSEAGNVHLSRPDGPAVEKRFEEIEHTADAAIKAYGRSRKALFENAAAGMFSLITDLRKVRPRGEILVRTTAEDIEQLMVHWLQELLYAYDAQGLLFSKFDVNIRGLNLRAKARGEAIDRARHPLRLNLKAVTYNNLVVDPRAGYATVVFDI